MNSFPVYKQGGEADSVHLVIAGPEVQVNVCSPCSIIEAEQMFLSIYPGPGTMKMQWHGAIKDLILDILEFDGLGRVS